MISARVDTVLPNTPAAQAGFKPGDLIVTINGRHVDNFNDMQRIVSVSIGQPLVGSVRAEGDHTLQLGVMRGAGRGRVDPASAPAPSGDGVAWAEAKPNRARSRPSISSHAA